MSPGCLHEDTPSAGTLGSAEHVSNQSWYCGVNSTHCSQQLQCSNAGTVILNRSSFCLCLRSGIRFMGQFAQCSITLRADAMFYVRFYSGNFRVTGVLTNLEPLFVSLTASDGPDVASAVSRYRKTQEHFLTAALVKTRGTVVTPGLRPFLLKHYSKLSI